MTSIAEMLGVQWDSRAGSAPSGFALSTHAARQAAAKGFHPHHVLEAANDPHHSYPNGRYPGQMRHVRDGIVAVVEPHNQRVVTVYADQVETAPRTDQTDRDARRYAGNYNRQRTVGGAR
jgi:hypothetical protein